jgi:phage terminase large subunit-like protein
LRRTSRREKIKVKAEAKIKDKTKVKVEGDFEKLEEDILDLG